MVGDLVLSFPASIIDFAGASCWGHSVFICLTENGLEWKKTWEKMRKKFGLFLDVLIFSVSIQFYSEETSWYGWAGQYPDTSLFVKFRCGTVGTGCPKHYRFTWPVSPKGVHGGPQPESEDLCSLLSSHCFSCFFICMWVCSLFVYWTMNERKISILFGFLLSKIGRKDIPKIWGKFMEPTNWWENLGEEWMKILLGSNLYFILFLPHFFPLCFAFISFTVSLEPNNL